MEKELRIEFTNGDILKLAIVKADIQKTKKIIKEIIDSNLRLITLNETLINLDNVNFIILKKTNEEN